MPLHDYQLVARDFLRGRDQAGLLLDMGLGKTAAALSALEPRHLPVCVVAPPKVAADVWPIEGKRWRPDLHVVCANGTAAERRATLADPNADVIAVGRNNVADLLTVERDRPFRTYILDELSSFKSRGAWWKTMRKVTKDPSLCVWGLTGTPAPNGLLDLWPQMFLLDKGERLGKTITGYRAEFFTAGRRLPNGVTIDWNLKRGSKERIYALIEDLCLSMDAKDKITLPPVTYNDVEVDLPRPIQRIHDEFKQELLVDLRDIFGGEVHTAQNAAIMTGKLSQITAGFMYVDDADIRGGGFTTLHKEKINAVKGIVDEANGSPVLVFYRFLPELEMLRRAFPQGVSINDKSYRQADWDAGRIPVMFAHPASAGHGLNLQHGGHTAVWTGPTWDLEHWDQANHRLDRQGQTHPVVIHTIMASRTIDQMIRRRLRTKADNQDDLLAYLESPI